MPSRLLSDLDPRVYAQAVAILAAWSKAGHDVIVTCTYRSNDEQDALYAQGRTKPGPIVTHARAGESLHNSRLALDFAPLTGGKVDWENTEKFEELGRLAMATDPRVMWGGLWQPAKRDMPHIEWKV